MFYTTQRGFATMSVQSNVGSFSEGGPEDYPLINGLT